MSECDDECEDIDRFEDDRECTMTSQEWYEWGLEMKWGDLDYSKFSLPNLGNYYLTVRWI